MVHIEQTDASVPFDYSEHVVQREIQQIMPHMEAAVGQMKERILAGTYGFIVCDDMSGRVPTLLMQGVINHVNQHAERPPISTAFINAKRFMDDPEKEKLSNFLNDLPDSENKKRGLIVTELISEGYHVGNLGEIIHEKGHSYDVVAAARVWGVQTYRSYGYLRENETIFPDRPHVIYNDTSLPYAFHIREALADPKPSRLKTVILGDTVAGVKRLVRAHGL